MGIGEGWELPPGAEPWSDFHWFQVSTRQELEVVILSERPVWYTGHFVRNRMAPCPGAGCEFCGAAIGSQIRYCFGVVELFTRRVGLLELGRSNGLLVQDWSYRSGGLRGMTLRLSKHSKSAQSRCVLEYVEEEPPGYVAKLVAPDPSLALYLTWHKAGFAMPEDFRIAQINRLSSGGRPVG